MPSRRNFAGVLRAWQKDYDTPNLGEARGGRQAGTGPPDLDHDARGYLVPSKAELRLARRWWRKSETCQHRCCSSCVTRD